MSTVFDFDQIHKPSYEPRAVDYETYFGEMGLTDKQVEDRIGFAEAIEEELSVTLNALAMIFAIGLTENIPSIRSRLVDRYCVIASRYTDDYDWILDRANEFVDDFLVATFGHKDESWYTSNDRAMFNAENEANTVMNHDDFIKAALSGKTMKRWVDIKDNRERASHRVVGGTAIPIDEYFEVGNSLMMFPHDPNGEPEELVNCRCHAEYF